MRNRLVTTVLAALALAGCMSLSAESPVPIGSIDVPTTSPTTSPEATSEPTDAPTPGSSLLPPTSTPTSTLAPVPSALRWERIGTLGPEGGIDVEWEQVQALVGFDGGYVAIASTYDGMSRVWFATDGAQWQEVTSFGDEFRAELGNGRPVIAASQDQVFLFAESDTDFTRHSWITSNGLDWSSQPFTCGTLDDVCGPLAVWPAQTGWQAAVYEAYQDSACDPFSCDRTVFWDSVDGATWERGGQISEGAFASEPGGMEDSTGLTVVAVENALHVSQDHGDTFETVPDAEACTNLEIALVDAGPVEALFGDAPYWVIGGRLADRGAQVCRHPTGGTGWEAVALPTESWFLGMDLDETPYGLLLNATRDCSDGGVCPPYDEQFLSVDGIEWVALTEALSEAAASGSMIVADGPGGVIGLTADFEEGSIIAWRLVDAATQ